MSDKVLIAEISGKRPGTKSQRPTEKYSTNYDKVIISNNSDGYETDWEIVNVPDDYRKWYTENIKSSDNAWYAPMNRSYAIKYAREKGYKYLVQLDDNIILLMIGFCEQQNGIFRRYRVTNKPGMLDDFISMFITVLENTNAAMVGCHLAGIGVPEPVLLSERYVYSIFALDLDVCPDVFQGDFEDDIEYRLKCAQMGYPVVQIPVLNYGKVGQEHSKDLSGCRAEYLKAGLKRGEHMSKLYGDIYSCKMTNKRNTVKSAIDSQNINFKHILKPFKVGVVVYNIKPINEKMQEILSKYAKHKPDKVIFKEKKIRRRS